MTKADAIITVGTMVKEIEAFVERNIDVISYDEMYEHVYNKLTEVSDVARKHDIPFYMHPLDIMDKYSLEEEEDSSYYEESSSYYEE